jgi:hypothetical protein
MKTRTTLLGSAMLAATLVLGTTAPGFTEQVPQTNTSTGTKKVEDIDQYKPGSGAPKSGMTQKQQHHKASTTGSGSSSMKSTTGSGANSKQMNTTTGTKKVDDPDQDKGSGAQNSNVGRTGNMR